MIQKARRLHVAFRISLFALCLFTFDFGVVLRRRQRRACPSNSRRAGTVGPAGHDQAILRRVSQRPRQNWRRQLRGTHGGEYRRNMPKCSKRPCASCVGASCRRPAPSSRTPRPSTRSSPGSRIRSTGRPARRTSRTRSCCIGSTARNMQTRFAISWLSSSMRPRSCRQTTRPRASTTSRRRCRCRPPSSSNM